MILRDKDALVDKYSFLVKKIANHLCSKLPSNIQVDDLVQSGMLGLFEASANFCENKGAKFETFASIRIRGAMLDEVRRGDWVPRSVYRNNRIISSAAGDLGQSLGRDAKDIEVASKLNVSMKEYHNILQDVFSSKIMGIDDSNLFGDQVDRNDKNSDKTFSSLVDIFFRQSLLEAIESLPERDVSVLSMYYDEAMNLKQIGAVLNISESRVSQIHTQAISKLKDKLVSWREAYAD